MTSDTSATPPAASQDSPGILRVFDVVSLLIGIVVGVSIFQVPSSVFALAGSPGLALLLWGIGAVLALCGALCYAELAAALPAFGAEYTYLAQAFGRRLGFLFAWMTVCAVLPGNIGAAAFVFANYAAQLLPGLTHSPGAVAAAAILALTILQFCGLVAGRAVQNALTVLKFLSLSTVVICGLMLPGAPVVTDAVPKTPQWHELGLALVFVLYAFGGWNDIATVTPEVRNCRRNMPLALIVGLFMVTIIYLALNAVFLHVLGYEGVKTTAAPAAIIVDRALGPAFSNLISLTIMASALGAMNGMLFAGCRLLTAVGEDFPLFSSWSIWNRRRVPVWALTTITLISLFLTGIVGTEAGRARFDIIGTQLGLQPTNWKFYGGGFEVLIAASAPIFWAFFFLTSIALIVLRVRRPDLPRPFRVPLYPIPAIIFNITAMYMLWSSLAYAGQLVFLLCPLFVIGILIALTQSRRSPAAD